MRACSIVSVVLIALAAGCTGGAGRSADGSGGMQVQTESTEPAKQDDSPYGHVVTYETEYYTTGPQQARPPDGRLKAGTKVELLQQAGSYSLVRSEDGVEGYIASDAITEISGTEADK